MFPRLLRYLDEAHRDGALGDGRYAVALGKAAKLNRFLTIIGQHSMPAREFTTELVMEYRQFLYDGVDENTVEGTPVCRGEILRV